MPLVWLFHFFWVTFAFVQRNHLQHVIVVVDADRSIALAPQRFIIVTASTADVKIDLEEQAYGTVITIFVRLTRGCVPSKGSVTLRDVPALAITWVYEAFHYGFLRNINLCKNNSVLPKCASQNILLKTSVS